MLQSLFFFLYSLLWRIAKPLLKKHKRLREGYEERLVCKKKQISKAWQEIQDKKDVDVWIQAASGGEAYLSLELLKQLADFTRQNNVSLHILCTSMTKQGMDVLERGKQAFLKTWQKKFQENPVSDPEISLPEISVPEISICYFPFDDRYSMHKAFAIARPKACILLETELWPHFMRECKENHSKLFIVNARMTEKAHASYRKIKAVLSCLAPDVIYATRKQDKDFYQEIFPHSLCKTMHNMKFDSIYHELLLQMRDNSPNPLQKSFDEKTCIWLFASVREEEEKDLQKLIAALHEQKTKSAIVIAPRHVARFAPWKKALEQCGLSVSYASELLDANRQITGKNIVVWDKFGDLKALYGMADYIFVGGSLAPLGGQNFMEALVHGRIPHTGIHLHNFLWTFELPEKKEYSNEKSDRQKNLAEENLLCMHKDIAMMTEIFSALPEKKFPNKHMVQEKFRTWLLPLTGDTEKVMTEILRCMNDIKA